MNSIAPTKTETTSDSGEKPVLADGLSVDISAMINAATESRESSHGSSGASGGEVIKTDEPRGIRGDESRPKERKKTEQIGNSEWWIIKDPQYENKFYFYNSITKNTVWHLPESASEIYGDTIIKLKNDLSQTDPFPSANHQTPSAALNGTLRHHQPAPENPNATAPQPVLIPTITDRNGPNDRNQSLEPVRFPEPSGQNGPKDAENDPKNTENDPKNTENDAENGQKDAEKASTPAAATPAAGTAAAAESDGPRMKRSRQIARFDWWEIDDANSEFIYFFNAKESRTYWDLPTYVLRAYCKMPQSKKQTLKTPPIQDYNKTTQKSENNTHSSSSQSMMTPITTNPFKAVDHLNQSVYRLHRTINHDESAVAGGPGKDLVAARRLNNSQFFEILDPNNNKMYYYDINTKRIQSSAPKISEYKDLSLNSQNHPVLKTAAQGAESSFTMMPRNYILDIESANTNKEAETANIMAAACASKRRDQPYPNCSSSLKRAKSDDINLSSPRLTAKTFPAAGPKPTPQPEPRQDRHRAAALSRANTLHRFVKKSHEGHPLVALGARKLLNSSLYRFGGGYSKVIHDESDLRLGPALSGELAYGPATSAQLAGLQLPGASGGYISQSELRALVAGQAAALGRGGHLRAGMKPLAPHANAKAAARPCASSGEAAGDEEEGARARRLDEELALLTLRDGQAPGRCAVGCGEARRAARLAEMAKKMRAMLREAALRSQQTRGRMLQLLSLRHSTGRQQASEVPKGVKPPPKVERAELARRVMARVSGLDRARLLEAASTSDLRQLLRMKTLLASGDALEKIYQFVYAPSDGGWFENETEDKSTHPTHVVDTNPAFAHIAGISQQSNQPLFDPTLPYVCFICAQRFFTERRLDAHFEEVHAPKVEMAWPDCSRPLSPSSSPPDKLAEGAGNSYSDGEERTQSRSDGAGVDIASRMVPWQYTNRGGGANHRGAGPAGAGDGAHSSAEHCLRREGGGGRAISGEAAAGRAQEQASSVDRLNSFKSALDSFETSVRGFEAPRVVMKDEPDRGGNVFER